MLRVAVDLGASNTCAALATGTGPPRLVLLDGAPVLPSAVCAAPGGDLFVGPEAQRQATVDPARYEPHPKRRIDEGELLLGDTVVPVVEVVRAVLARVVAQAQAGTGTKVELLVLTHPAGWAATRTGVLRRAAAPLAREIVLVPEPVAAAWCYATESSGTGQAAHPGVPPWRTGQALLVVDFGGATLDVSVVRDVGTPAGPVLEVLATAGDPALGGADLDQLLFDHVGAVAGAADPAAWAALARGGTLDARRRARALRTDVRTAKETLSRHPYADVPMPPPFPDVHVTRAEFEGLVGAALAAVPALLDTALDAAARRCGGERPALGAVFLTGGSSRIPLLARLVRRHTGLVPDALELPETAVALGALRCVLSDAGPLPVPGPAVAPGRGRRRGGRRGRRRGGRRRRRAIVAGSCVLAVVAAGVGTAALGEWRAATTVSGPAYRFALPAGWERHDGDPARREVRLVPPERPGRAGVHVQANRLGYDIAALPGRPVRELRARLAAAPTGRYSDFAPSHSYAGRAVVYYREHPADGSTVDWYLVFQGHTQISVGCRHDPATRPLVGYACLEVVRTVRIQE